MRWIRMRSGQFEERFHWIRVYSGQLEEGRRWIWTHLGHPEKSCSGVRMQTKDESKILPRMGWHWFVRLFSISLSQKWPPRANHCYRLNGMTTACLLVWSMSKKDPLEPSFIVTSLWKGSLARMSTWASMQDTPLDEAQLKTTFWESFHVFTDLFSIF